MALLALFLLGGRDTLVVPLLTGGLDEVGDVTLDRVWTPAVNGTAAAAFVVALFAAPAAAVLHRRARPGSERRSRSG
jgi:hypothetical protein